MPGLDESDDIIPVIDVLVPDEVLEGSADFRAITTQARTNFDEFIKAVMPSEDQEGSPCKRARNSDTPPPNPSASPAARVDNAAEDLMRDIHAMGGASKKGAECLAFTGEPPGQESLQLVRRLSEEQQRRILHDAFAQQGSLSARLFAPILAEVHDAVRMMGKCVALLAHITFQCNGGDPLTMSEGDLAACAPTPEDGGDQGAKLPQAIQALHSAFLLLQSRATHAARVYRTGELSPVTNWETVQQMVYRQAFDEQNKKLDDTIVPLTDFNEMVKEAMDALGQGRRNPAPAATKLPGPVCPELAKPDRRNFTAGRGGAGGRRGPRITFPRNRDKGAGGTKTSGARALGTRRGKGTRGGKAQVPKNRERASQDASGRRRIGRRRTCERVSQDPPSDAGDADA